MIDALTIFNASTDRRTYWRLNREAGAATLDEAIALTWEDFYPYEHMPQDDAINMDGMDDIFEVGGPENMEIVTHGGGWFTVEYKNGCSQEEDTRDHPEEWNQWEQVTRLVSQDYLTLERGFTVLDDTPAGHGDEFGRIYWVIGDTTEPGTVDRKPKVLTGDEVIERSIKEGIRSDLELEQQVLPPVDHRWNDMMMQSAALDILAGVTMASIRYHSYDAWEDVEMLTRHFHGKI